MISSMMWLIPTIILGKIKFSDHCYFSKSYKFSINLSKIPFSIEYGPNIDAAADNVSSINNNMNIDLPVLVNQNENILLYGSKVDAIVDNKDDAKKFNNGGKLKKKKRKKTSKNLNLKDLKRHNLNVRKLIFRYIRRPGQGKFNPMKIDRYKYCCF